MSDFDLEGARRAGYSDDEIVDYLGAKKTFDVAGARENGYTAAEILGHLAPATVEPTPQSGWRRVADVGVSALKGAISIPEAVVGLADIPTGGAAGKVAEEIGFRPREAKAALDELLSEKQKAANRELDEAKGFWGTAAAMVRNPSTIGHALVESAPSMIAGGAVGRGVLAVAPKAAPWAAGAVGEGVVGAGSAAESVRQGSADGLLTTGQAGAALGSGVGTALFGAVGARVAKRLGVADVDTLLAGGSAKSLDGLAMRIVKGGIAEGVFEEMPQSAQEKVWFNAAMDRPLLEGVPEAAAQGLIVGAAMGGGVAAVVRERNPIVPILDAKSVDEAIDAAQRSVDFKPQNIPAMKADNLSLAPDAPADPGLDFPRADPMAAAGAVEAAERAQAQRQADAARTLDYEAPVAPGLALAPLETPTEPQGMLYQGSKDPLAPATAIEDAERAQAEQQAQLAAGVPSPAAEPSQNIPKNIPSPAEGGGPAQEQLDAAGPEPVQATAAPGGEVSASLQPSIPKTEEFLAPKSIPARGIIKGQVMTFKTEKGARTYAHSNKLRGFQPRQDGKGFVLSKTVVERSQAQKANDAKLKSKAKNARPEDDALTVLRKAGGLNRAAMIAEGADPAAFKGLNAQHIGLVRADGNGGLTADGAAEILAQHGFDMNDEHGAIDASKALDVILDSFNGVKHYTAQGQELRAAAESEKAAAAPPVDRREDSDERKRVSEMTDEEKTKALLTSEKTGLGNQRAFNEAQKKPVQAAIDADNLKFINDNLGHDAGDRLLRSLGEALAAEGVEAFHVSGDEFTAQFATEEQAYEAMGRVRDRLDRATLTIQLPDGSKTTKTGVGFSYGIGPDQATAEIDLQRDKSEREDAGARAPRGEEPPGIRREPPAGEQAARSNAAAEGGVDGRAEGDQGRDRQDGPAARPEPVEARPTARGDAAGRDEGADVQPPGGVQQQGESGGQPEDPAQAKLESGPAPAKVESRPRSAVARKGEKDGTEAPALAGVSVSGGSTASWVLRNKATGEVIAETFDRKKVEALNTEKYEAVPIQEYLASLNKKETPALARDEETGQFTGSEGSFDSEAFDRKRNEAIAESRKTRKHLDRFDPSVEGMRGKRIEYVHNPGQRGEVITVSNRGDVFVWWADKASAEREMASEVKDKNGKVIAYESSLGPRDLKDYAVLNPEHRYDPSTYKRPKLGKEASQSPAPALELTGETEREIRDREAAAAREDAEKKKRSAAAPADDFTLTGSNSPADQARARGQRELGDDTPAPPARSIADVPPALLKRITVPVEQRVEGEGVKTIQVSAAEALADNKQETEAYERLLECVSA